MNTNFKDYNQQQNWLFPPSIEELIPEDHPVRIVNGVIEQLDISLLIEQYSKEGVPSYHPKMMLKVMIICRMDNLNLAIMYRSAPNRNMLFIIHYIKPPTTYLL